jgi:hypothetical protein
MDITKLVSKFEAKRCYTAVAIVVMVISTLIALQPYVSTQAMSSADIKRDPPSLPTTANLTLVALNGTTRVLNSSQITALPSITAPGGYFSDGATPPYSTYNYTGVSLNTLANLVGGLTSGEVLSVVGSDGYTRNFTYSQVVNGNFSAYTENKTTGVATVPTKPVVAIVAYYNNSQLIPGNWTKGVGSGPLMVAIVGNNSLVTPGKFWVKWVDKVKILPTTIPEFPAVSLVSLFIALTLIAVVSSVWLGRKSLKKPFFTKHDESV